MAPGNVDELRRELAAGKMFTFVCFWGHTSKGGALDRTCLSQWWPAPFTLESISYASAEMYMMAEKARVFHDVETRSQILATTNPKAVKALGRAVRGYDEALWERERFDVVVRGSTAKFSQDPALRAFLVGTGDAILVEASPVDAVWGIGVAEKDPRARDPHQWPGRNLLGFALMRARAALLAGA